MPPFVNHKHGFQESIKSASALSPLTPVKLAGSNALLVLKAGTNADRVAGMVDASCGAGEQVTVYGEGNIVKALAGASVGVGAEVGVGSDNGSLSPAAAASGRQALGVSRTPAAAGEYFSVEIRPRQVY
jgi:hypothetical protein